MAFPTTNQSPYGPVLKAYIDEQVAAAVAAAVAAQADADTAGTTASSAATAASTAASAAAAAQADADSAQSGLASKADAQHGHTMGQIEDLAETLEGLEGGSPPEWKTAWELPLTQEIVDAVQAASPLRYIATTANGFTIQIEKTGLLTLSNGWLTASEADEPSLSLTSYFTTGFQWGFDYNYDVPSASSSLTLGQGEFSAQIRVNQDDGKRYLGTYFFPDDNSYLTPAEGHVFQDDPNDESYKLIEVPTTGKISLRGLPSGVIEFYINDELWFTVFNQYWMESESVYWGVYAYEGARLKAPVGYIYGTSASVEILNYSGLVDSQFAQYVRRVDGNSPDDGGDVQLPKLINYVNRRYEIEGAGRLDLPGFFMGKWVDPALRYMNISANMTALEYFGLAYDGETQKVVVDVETEINWPDQPYIRVPASEMGFYNNRSYRYFFQRDWSTFYWGGDGTPDALIIQLVTGSGEGFVVVQHDQVQLTSDTGRNRFTFHVRADMEAIGLTDDDPLELRLMMASDLAVDMTGVQVESVTNQGYLRGDVVVHNGKLWQSAQFGPEPGSSSFGNQTEPGVGDGWIELPVAADASYKQYELTAADSEVTELGSLTKVEATEPLDLVLPTVPGFVGTLRVLGIENITWPPGTVVLGTTEEEDLYVNLINEGDHWTVLIPLKAQRATTYGDAPFASETLASLIDGTLVLTEEQFSPVIGQLGASLLSIKAVLNESGINGPEPEPQVE